MKKVIAIFLAMVMMLTVLAGCSTTAEDDQKALKIGNTEYTVKEVNYMYVNLFNDIYNTYYSYYGDQLTNLLDITKPLEEQDISEDMTWHDYLLGYVEYGMTNITAIYEAAIAEGFTLPDDYAENLATLEPDLRAAAEEYGISFEEYIEVMYGEGMTYDTVYKMTEMNYIVGAYSAYIEENTEVTLDELREYYEANKDTYDTVNFRFCTFYPETGEPTDEEKAELKAKADKFSDVKTEEEFTELAWSFASDEDKEIYDKESMTLYTGATQEAIGMDGLNEWLFDEARTPNEVYIYEDETYGSYIAVMFLERTNQDYDAVNVRHILIAPEDEEMTDAVKADLKGKAEEILAEFLAGDKTEEAFGELAKEYSADTGSASNGGLLKNTGKNKTVKNFNDWIYDSERKPGDTGIVESQYGYHIIYFAGMGDNNLISLLEKTLRQEKSDKWLSDLSADVEVEKFEGYEKVGGMIDDIVNAANAHEEALAAASEAENTEDTEGSESTESTESTESASN